MNGPMKKEEKLSEKSVKLNSKDAVEMDGNTWQLVKIGRNGLISKYGSNFTEDD
jgi:hypothetical protein